MTAAETASVSGVTHMLYPYADHDEYLSGTLAYIEHARAEGGTVVVAAEPSRREQLRAHLPGTDTVVFVDPATVGRNPGRIIPAWQQWIGQVAKGRPVHGINESVWSGRDAAHVNELRYQEWLLNRAFAQAPGWSLMCPFDTAGQDATVVSAIARCHPLLWDGAKTVSSTGYIVGDYPFEALAEPAGKVRRLAFDLSTLSAAREAICEFAAACGLPDDRVVDLKLAISEVATNSIRYGGGSGVARTWQTEHSVVCELADNGVITDPLVGLVQPTSSQVGGRGLWFVNNLCDLVEIRSSPGSGTRVRVSMDLKAANDS
ncbi:MAG TPA: sensor histidine kinase [Actinospica sp.]|jgi:anti-sigma regulatory factor (Ser/Thr protein kinase)|nr:sensor histidine kinase [Actinospica sp.]